MVGTYGFAGNSEFFINLKENTHLDSAYGGYCVFAVVADDASFTVCNSIAKKVTEAKSVKIISVEVV